MEEKKIINAKSLESFSKKLLLSLNCTKYTANIVSKHLVDSNLHGVDSHGVIRLQQYHDQILSGYFSAHAEPKIIEDNSNVIIVDGRNGFGITALHEATKIGVKNTNGKQNISMIVVKNCAHTGRLGSFTEKIANKGFFCLCFGGGAYKNWKQVAPFGGKKAVLPTNPYSLAMPGGKNGSIVVDFATGSIAGGWITEAKLSNSNLPLNSIIDKNGMPTINPDDYINGGSILPAGGPKGYGLGLIAELVGGAMLGKVTTEMNWILMIINFSKFNDNKNYSLLAENILSQVRNCPPRENFSRVEIPGEMERKIFEKRKFYGIPISNKLFVQLNSLAIKNKIPLLC